MLTNDKAGPPPFEHIVQVNETEEFIVTPVNPIKPQVPSISKEGFAAIYDQDFKDKLPL